jgi:hypothetical protein
MRTPRAYEDGALHARSLEKRDGGEEGEDQPLASE